ncbi:MAG: nucleotidyl transferase AbiEii/AbiGii toxin family protein [Chloroflexi bacterium]|nr:nucleotidyl transferase AbiEii/AbiGii toxin family protein [Chloroflexota bacterium]
MAALEHPHWEAIPPRVRDVLERIGKTVQLAPFYLAGGIALALRRGHRVSQDLDFFGAVENFDDDWTQRLISEFRAQFDVRVERDSFLGVTLDVEGASVSFMTYGYALLDSTDELARVQIAGLTDIGLMKLDAISSRGARKDFYDLYCVAREMSLDSLFQQADAKFPNTPYFVSRSLEALVDFEIADKQDEPELLVPVAWAQVKMFFTEQARRLGHLWIQDS